MPEMTASERWEACGEPDIICHDDGQGGGCYYIGPDVEKRVCEVCYADEPDDEADICPACEAVTWWVPKCPKCGKGCTWTYGEIKPMEYQKIMEAKECQAQNNATS